MDALYALSDTYLHFPQNSISKRGKDLVYGNNETDRMFRREEILRLEFIINIRGVGGKSSKRNIGWKSHQIKAK